MLCQADTIRPGGRGCNLCLSEKIGILKSDKKLSLNKKSEIFGKCRHLEDTLLNSLIWGQSQGQSLGHSQVQTQDQAQDWNGG